MTDPLPARHPDEQQDEPVLPPTEELIAEVLAARHRLGEPFWPISRRNRKALDSLADKGYRTVGRVLPPLGGW